MMEFRLLMVAIKSGSHNRAVVGFVYFLHVFRKTTLVCELFLSLLHLILQTKPFHQFTPHLGKAISLDENTHIPIDTYTYSYMPEIRSVCYPLNVLYCRVTHTQKQEATKKPKL